MQRYMIYYIGVGRTPEEFYAPNEKEARAQCKQRLRRFDMDGRIYCINHVKYVEPNLPNGRCKHINREYKTYTLLYPNREITFKEYLIQKSMEV